MQTAESSSQQAPATVGHNSPDTDIVSAYCEKTKGSQALAEQARECFPSGVTHDGRYILPHGIYVDRAAGPHKWDVVDISLIVPIIWIILWHRDL